MADEVRGLTFPPIVGPDAGLATLDTVNSVRAMLEQILFTEPGERVNRPTFGVGVLGALFEPNSPFLQTRIRIALEENVYDHLGLRVSVDDIGVEQDQAEIHIRIAFTIEGTVLGPQEMAVSVPMEAGR
ncbi:MAG: GPW/gp25 family protein [Proteobacteria bacterium]|nr:GPW/gp25 family protein [Pseudomonadota bacterium]